MAFLCASCGRRYADDSGRWCCECGGLLEPAERTAFQTALIERGEFSLWRYRKLLPLPEGAQPVSLGEGWTPIVSLELAGRPLQVKLEFLAPSGSFKDRGTSVLVSALGALGVRRVVEDSSGNAAASLAAYAARAGIEAQICVPAYTSPAKLRQIEVYGARAIRVPGPRERAGERARQLAGEKVYYASHVYSPWALAGLKTFVYELWEQLGEKLPEWLIYPVGQGTFLYSSYLGLCELKEAGLIRRLPRLVAVQAERCAPLWAAFEGHSPTQIAEQEQQSAGLTIAEGIAMRSPVRLEQVVRALCRTGGQVVTVSEEEIYLAQQELAHQGLYVEPTSAAALAGYQALQPATRRRRLYWLASYAAMALGTLEKGPIAFLVPGLVLLVYGLFERRRVNGGGWFHLAGVGLFLAVCQSLEGTAVLNSVSTVVFAATATGILCFYRLLWWLAGGDSPGMAWAKLRLLNFDGRPPTRSQRAQRFLGTCLSLAAGGLGLFWALGDEEKLGWNDHISKTFPTPRPPQP